MMNKPVFYKSYRSRKYTEELNNTLSLGQITPSSRKVILDIGFGTGESTIYLSKKYNDYIIYGFESYKPGIKNLTDNNIQVYYGDAIDALNSIDTYSVDRIYMLFPDPWQKKRHRKRRLFNSYTFKLINEILKTGGYFHFATDNINYAMHSKRVIQDITLKTINFSRSRVDRPITKFEQKALDKKNFIFDLIYIKK